MPAPSVQWQASTDGGTTFADIPGAITPIYTFTAAASNNGTEYRAVFTNPAGWAVTNPAVLTVDTAPVVTTQPSPVTVDAGQAVSFTAVATGIPAPSVQWQASTPYGGTTFADIPGATTPTYTFTVAATNNGTQYRAVFTNAAGSATTNPVVLTVRSPVVYVALRVPLRHGDAGGHRRVQHAWYSYQGRFGSRRVGY